MRRKESTLFSYLAAIPKGGPLEGILKAKGLDFKTHCFYVYNDLLTYCREISRQAENALREELDIPKVGEGWVAETELFYKIKTEFPQFQVVQHASPKWIGKQHLDIIFTRN